MVSSTYVQTRNAVHGLAEYVLAGPQYATSGTIRLRPTRDGFGTVARPTLRIEGGELVVSDPVLYAVVRIPIDGHRFSSLAEMAGVKSRDLRDVYAGTPKVDIDDDIALDVTDAVLIFHAWGAGAAAMAELAPETTPVIWPEHLDVAIAVDEVNYGVSPGDDYCEGPYAYVGPFTPRTGEFWNAPFGASLELAEQPSAIAILDFFRAGRQQL